MQDLVDIAANEFENKAEIATSENMVDAIVNTSGFKVDEEIDRRLGTVLILPSQLSLQVTSSRNAAERILKRSNDVNRNWTKAYMHTCIPTNRQS